MTSKNTLLIIMGLLIVAGLLAAGCTQPTAPAQTPTLTPTTAAAVGMANPASVNCGKVGAVNEIMKNADGSEFGMCKFPNGTSCEEWALYRGEGCKPKVASTTSPTK